MTFPIDVQVYHRRHTGGTKVYHAVLLSGKDGKSILFTRYGKTTAYGSVHGELFDTLSAATMAFKTKCREKSARGYTISHVETGVDADSFCFVIKSVNELSTPAFKGKNITKMISGLERDHLRHLFGNKDGPLTAEDLELVNKLDEARRDDERKAKIAADAAFAKEKAEEEAARERSKAMNKNWGMF